MGKKQSVIKWYGNVCSFLMKNVNKYAMMNRAGESLVNDGMKCAVDEKIRENRQDI